MRIRESNNACLINKGNKFLQAINLHICRHSKIHMMMKSTPSVRNAFIQSSMTVSYELTFIKLKYPASKAGNLSWVFSTQF